MIVQQRDEITVKELARRIREAKKVVETKENVSLTIPSKVKVIGGNVTLSEGANVGFLKKNNF